MNFPRRLLTTPVLTVALALGCSPPALSGEPNTKSEPGKPAPAKEAMPNAKPAFEFKQEWTFARDAQSWKNLQGMTNKPAPALKVDNWIGEAQDLAKLKGQIVIIDFWGTWCPPCIAAIPHTNDVMEKYKPKGVAVFGVCNTRGSEKMKNVVDTKGMKYPTAKDVNDQSARAYGVSWWPFYVLVDREGMIRAAGLRPDGVDKALDALLAEQPAPEKPDDKQARAADAAPQFPPMAQMLLAAANAGEKPAADDESRWLEGDAKRREKLSAIQGKAPAALQVDGWMNSSPLKLDELKGKVVLIDFWGTWCPPCRASVPKMNELAKKYKEKGLVIIGVSTTRGAEKMSETAKQLGIEYPIAADLDNATVKAYHVDGYPDYFLIDRAGTLRYADVNNGMVETAVEKLLAE